MVGYWFKVTRMYSSPNPGWPTVFGYYAVKYGANRAYSIMRVFKYRLQLNTTTTRPHDDDFHI